jgi:hypothetical protein
MEALPVPVRKPHVGRMRGCLAEVYLLVCRYWRDEYRRTWSFWLILLQYLLLALLIAFAHVGLGNGTGAARTLSDVAYRESALIGIRLAITVTTIPIFITAFTGAREAEIRGRGPDRIKYGPTAVYLAKFLVLNFFRVLLFVPFTAIIYPVVGLRGGFDRALLFMLILMIQQYAAISVGLLVAAGVADTAVAATIVGPILAVFILLDGGAVDRVIPEGLAWLQYLSISFYSQNALFLNEFGGVSLPDGTTSSQLLARFGYTKLTKCEAMGYLTIYAVLCQAAGILVLNLSCAHHNRRLNKV